MPKKNLHVLVTAAAADAALLDGVLERRSLALKGKSEPVEVVVLGPGVAPS